MRAIWREIAFRIAPRSSNLESNLRAILMAILRAISEQSGERLFSGFQDSRGRAAKEGNPALELPGLQMSIPIQRSNKEIDVCSDGSQTEKIRNLDGVLIFCGVLVNVQSWSNLESNLDCFRNLECNLESNLGILTLLSKSGQHS